MKCTQVIKKEELMVGNKIQEVLEVTIDDYDKSLWIYRYADALKFVGQDVIVEYREDIYKGEIHKFINTFTTMAVINTLDKKTDIKLYADQVDDHSNIVFADLAEGDQKMDAIMYCISQRFESSAKASWCTFTVRDSLLRISNLRLFDFDKRNDFTGKYIKADVRKSKYGLQTEMVIPVEGMFAENVEITIAKQYILDHFSNDETALKYITGTNLLELMSKEIDYEQGYSIVRLAMELSMCNQLYNVTKDVDIAVIEHAILATYGYVAMSVSLSNPVKSLVIASRYQWPNVQKVLQILDPTAEERPDEYDIYNRIRSLIEDILNVRKGIKKL